MIIFLCNLDYFFELMNDLRRFLRSFSFSLLGLYHVSVCRCEDGVVGSTEIMARDKDTKGRLTDRILIRDKNRKTELDNA